MKSFNPHISLTTGSLSGEITLKYPDGLVTVNPYQDKLFTATQGSSAHTSSYVQKAQQDNLSPDMRTILDNLEDLIIELKDDRRSIQPSQEGYKALMEVYDKVIRKLMDYRYSLTTSNQN